MKAWFPDQAFNLIYIVFTDTERLSHLSSLLEEYARELQRPYIGYDTLWRSIVTSSISPVHKRDYIS